MKSSVAGRRRSGPTFLIVLAMPFVSPGVGQSDSGSLAGIYTVGERAPETFTVQLGLQVAASQVDIGQPIPVMVSFFSDAVFVTQFTALPAKQTYYKQGQVPSKDRIILRIDITKNDPRSIPAVMRFETNPLDGSRTIFVEPR